MSRRWLVPEVVQTSAMDCGPAALKCLLEGFGVGVSYGRLREACQTDVDGSSIDTLEEVAKALGLEAEQIMLPVDHVLLKQSEALPAIAVVRLPNGVTHFVVAWSVHAGLVQVMDPALGRVWQTRREFESRLYVHAQVVSAEAWRSWAGSQEFMSGLATRLERIRLRPGAAERLQAQALEDPSWRALGCLDAATRMVSSLIEARSLKSGQPAERVLERLRALALAELDTGSELIPAAYWSVRPAPAADDGDEQVSLRGAILVRARGVKQHAGATPPSPALGRELAAALTERAPRPGRRLLEMLRRDGLATPACLIAGLLLAAASVVIEALLLRGLLDVGSDLGLTGQRLGAIVALLGFIALTGLLELPILSALLRHGRAVELRLRQSFLMKLPLLGDRYFASRLTSDMAERCHALHRLRMLPQLAGEILRTGFELALTALAIAWLSPESALLAFATAAVSLGLPLVAQPILTERDLRLRNHAGALSRFYLDALLGLVAVRTHSAESAVKREHEALLVTWARAAVGLLRSSVAVSAATLVMSFGLVAAMLFAQLGKGDQASLLLLVYWALKLPLLGERLNLALRQYPALRNTTLRAIEPLGAPSEASPTHESPAQAGATSGDQTSLDKRADDRATSAPGASLAFHSLSVRAAGHSILSDVSFELSAGEHVAIVGTSGAGKSSLVGALLGWHRPHRGWLDVDGRRLESGDLQSLRDMTAWVDPSVQLWNRPFVDNLLYGTQAGVNPPLGWAIEQADLLGVLERLPEGLQTPLGEGGGLVSGGEGQRVRLARALLRPNVRLVILDEPFRGLDRERRSELLKRVRALWSRATLLCITHDISETLGFERVLVVDAGRLVEDASPSELSSNSESRYAELLNAEAELRTQLWRNASWRRVAIAAGELTETPGGEAS